MSDEIGEARWFWAPHSEAEHWHGPFKTREKAYHEGLTDLLRDGAPLGTKPVIGIGKWPDPGDYIEMFDYAYFLEVMDQNAVDDGWYAGEGPLFHIPLHLRGEAENALKAALRSWAQKYTKPVFATVRPERGTLEGEPDASP